MLLTAGALLVVLGGPAIAAVDPDELGTDEIIYVKRKPYSSDHYYTDIDNGTSSDRFVPDNGIYVYNVRTQNERAVLTAAAMPGGKGFIGKISLSFDAKKVLFDFRADPTTGFRIWEVNIDGTCLRQVLYAPEDEATKVARWGRKWHTDDIHPCYLPDGKIVFSSTRCEHTILCGGSAALVAPVLHRMDADGTNVEQLNKSPVSEFCPVVLDDGRVMYHRWEYVDKGARVCKTIWSMNPDGTMSHELYGVTDDTTTVYMYPQAMPGNGNRIVCVGTCHFPQGGCLGAIMLIDLQRGMRQRGPDPDEPGYLKFDDRYAVTNITPDVFIERRTEPGWHFLKEDGKYVHDRNGKSGHLYTHPYPVSENEFLVSYKVEATDHYKNVPNAYALYLIDIDGNRRLVHRDAKLSLWHPIPLVARNVPPKIKTNRHPLYAKTNEALCIVTNIHHGMDVNYQPGEIRSCTGCHGRTNHTSSPAASQTPLAITRPPSAPQPQPCDLVENGGDGSARQVIHYPSDIQPIFDANCVSCHGNKSPAGELRLTGDLTVSYNVSYEELCKKQLAGPIISEFTTFDRGDQGNYCGATLPPMSLGTQKSVMLDMLTDPDHPKNAQDDHAQLLEKNELMILSRWIDSNYQFYGSYYGRHHSAWTKADQKKPTYLPKDFRRKATFEEAINSLAPDWHR